MMRVKPECVTDLQDLMPVLTDYQNKIWRVYLGKKPVRFFYNVWACFLYDHPAGFL